jgi:hypothetical protein
MLYAAVIVTQIVDLGKNLLYSVLDLFSIECGAIMHQKLWFTPVLLYHHFQLTLLEQIVCFCQ